MNQNEVSTGRTYTRYMPNWIDYGFEDPLAGPTHLGMDREEKLNQERPEEAHRVEGSGEWIVDAESIGLFTEDVFNAQGLRAGVDFDAATVLGGKTVYDSYHWFKAILRTKFGMRTTGRIRNQDR